MSNKEPSLEHRRTDNTAVHTTRIPFQHAQWNKQLLIILKVSLITMFMVLVVPLMVHKHPKQDTLCSLYTAIVPIIIIITM